jgi:uncharacterized protein YndB with AHSA1/START domain
MKKTLPLGLLLVLSLAAGSLPLRARGAEPLVHEGRVAAAPASVWAALTTAAGQASWMVAQSDIDLRVGGLMRSHYDPKGTLGDAGTIENTVLSFDPPHMFSIQVSKPPAGFPFPAEVKKMWTVIYLDVDGPAATRVRIVGHGFGDDEAGQKLRQFFDRGNAFTLKQLQERFAAPAR